MTLQASGSAISLNDLHVEVGGSSGTTCSLGDTDVAKLIFRNPTDSKNLNEYYGTFWNKNTLTFTSDTKLHIDNASSPGGGGAYGYAQPSGMTGFMTHGAGGASTYVNTNSSMMVNYSTRFGMSHGPVQSNFRGTNQVGSFYYKPTDFGSCSDTEIRINGGPIHNVLAAFTTTTQNTQLYVTKGLYIALEGLHSTSDTLATTLGATEGGLGRMQANTVNKQGSDPVSDPSGGLMDASQVGNYIMGGASDYNTSTYANTIAGTTITSGTRYTYRSTSRAGASIIVGKPDFSLTAGPTGTSPTGSGDYVTQQTAAGSESTKDHTFYCLPMVDHPNKAGGSVIFGYQQGLNTTAYAMFSAAEAANAASYDPTGTVHNYPTGANSFRHNATITLTFT